MFKCLMNVKVVTHQSFGSPPRSIRCVSKIRDTKISRQTPPLAVECFAARCDSSIFGQWL